MEDKWERFFNNPDAQGQYESQPRNEEEQMHTMPSFREGAGDDCEKTLSVIYDDTDLVRDPMQSFAIGRQSHHPYSTNTNLRSIHDVHSPADFKEPLPSDSIEVTAEQPNRVYRNMIASMTSSVPQYETNNEPRLPPYGKQPTALRASNQEIEDEMRMYSTV